MASHAYSLFTDAQAPTNINNHLAILPDFFSKTSNSTPPQLVSNSLSGLFSIGFGIVWGRRIWKSAQMLKYLLLAICAINRKFLKMENSEIRKFKMD